MASKPSFTSHKAWSSHGAMHGPQKKKYLWAYPLSTRWAKAPSYEAKPRPSTIFMKKYHRAWVKKNQKGVPFRGAPTAPIPSTPSQLAVSKIDCHHLLFLHVTFFVESVQQISVQHLRSDKRDDCDWAFPLYPDGTKLSLEKHNYSHVKKNTLGVVPGGQTKGYSSCSGTDHATPLTAERWALINISTVEPAVKCKPVHRCLVEPWGKGVWKQGEKVEEEECL